MKSGRAAGFTLIELMITVALVGLLSTMVLPLTELTVQRSKEQELRSALREIRMALDEYKKAVDEKKIISKAGKSGYPESLTVLLEGVPDATNPDNKLKIRFLRRMPRDPMAIDPNLRAVDTWGTRSYSSEWDNPSSGDDVFDVYSLSDKAGMNGVAYNKW
jgi:general secretion pathway protein G